MVGSEEITRKQLVTTPKCKLFDLQNTPESFEINCDGNDVEGLGRFLLEKAGWPAPIPRRGSAEKKATTTTEEKRRSFTQGNFHVEMRKVRSSQKLRLDGNIGVKSLEEFLKVS